jgi:predicted DNA-binding transcriptional regulator YafY
LQLLNLLSGKMGRTLDQLADVAGVTKRTIQRDISVIEQRFPVCSENRDGSIVWRLVDQTQVPEGLGFTIPELMALYFSRDLLQVLRGSPMDEALKSAIQKIGAQLPASGHELVRRLRGQTAVSAAGWKDYSRSYDCIRALDRAIRHRSTVNLVHIAVRASEAKIRQVDPYRLWYTSGGLYLIGHDHLKKAIRTFAVERIREISTTNLHFTIRDDFDFEEFSRTAFPIVSGEPQRVLIHFSKEEAPYVMERHWHPSQKFSRQDDGSIVMELQVASLWEVKRWLLGWGAGAKVVEPLELKEAIQQECATLLAG